MSEEEFSEGRSRRKHHRENDIVVVRYRPVSMLMEFFNKKTDDSLVSTGSSVNVSAGGMFLRLTENFPLKTVLDLTFRLTSEGNEIHCLAEVVRHHWHLKEGLYYLAVMFTSISAEDRAEIQDYIDDLQFKRQCTVDALRRREMRASREQETIIVNYDVVQSGNSERKMEDNLTASSVDISETGMLIRVMENYRKKQC